MSGLSPKRTTDLVIVRPRRLVESGFAFTKTRYRGIAKNLNHLQMLFASANWLMRARALSGGSQMPGSD
jgi:hypothetical protein